MAHLYYGRQYHDRNKEVPNEDYNNDYCLIADKMPITPTHVSPYTNVHKVVHKRVVFEEDEAPVSHSLNHHRMGEKKMQVIEEKKIIEQDKNGNYQVIEETIDVEADGFIEQKHKAFELRKWKTFN